MLQHQAEVVLEEVVVFLNLVVGLKDFFRARVLGESPGAGPRKQPRYEIGAVLRELEKRLVEKMLEQVQPTNIENKTYPGFKSQGVREVLFRADADVDAAGLDALLQFRDDILKTGFVREQIV